MNYLPFIFKRAGRNWRLLSVLAIGVIFSTGLLAGAPVLVDSVIELGLPRRLKNADPADANLRVSTFESLGQVPFTDVDDSVQSKIQTSFAGHLDRIVLSISSHWAHPWLGEVLLRDERINLRFFEDFENQVEFLEGSWPASQPDFENEDIRVAIGESMAERYNLGVGDRLPLSYQSQARSPDFHLEIAAVVRALDPGDPFWLGSASPLYSQGNRRYVEQYSVLLPREAFLEANRLLFPRARSELACWIRTA